jgi:hypothetical protein
MSCQNRLAPPNNSDDSIIIVTKTVLTGSVEDAAADPPIRPDEDEEPQVEARGPFWLHYHRP